MPLGVNYSTVARLIRLLRVMRLCSRSKEMSVVAMTIIKLIPYMANIFLLLSLLFFIYSITEYHLFDSIDPEHWNSLPRSAFTLFQILTLGGGLGRNNVPCNTYQSFVCSLFFSFIVVGTFIVINIFIAVIVRKSEDEYKALEEEIRNPVTQKEILFEIHKIRKKLDKSEYRLVK